MPCSRYRNDTMPSRRLRALIVEDHPGHPRELAVGRRDRWRLPARQRTGRVGAQGTLRAAATL